MVGSQTVTTPCPLPRVKFRAYWQLVKSLQTGLLLVTGVAGYMSGRPSSPTWTAALSLVGSLFLAVGGSTVLNMVIDRDIDARMQRTARRPLPAGTITTREGLMLGLGMSLVGTLWAIRLVPLYGAVVFAGLFVDVIVYTLWLKRRTAWSIVWGGIAGGMPVLAGRVLATGRVDVTGLLLALAVLLWIPTHMLTFGIKYASDYAAAGVPVFANRYSVRVARWMIGISTFGAVVVMLWCVYRIGVNPALLWAARGLGGLLMAFTIVTVLHTTPRLNHVLYKLASLYMLASMVLLIVGA